MAAVMHRSASGTRGRNKWPFLAGGRGSSRNVAFGRGARALSC
jgi:hypothetical protein